MLNRYSALDRDVYCEVAIVGAGITGALVAYHLAPSTETRVRASLSESHLAIRHVYPDGILRNGLLRANKLFQPSSVFA